MAIQTIGFIGLGNMAKAIIGGILKNELVKPENIIGSSATQETMQAAADRFGICTERSNKEVARRAVRENCQRLNRIDFGNVVCDAVRIEIQATNGLPAARIYEVRVYGSEGGQA